MSALSVSPTTYLADRCSTADDMINLHSMLRTLKNHAANLLLRSVARAAVADNNITELRWRVPVLSGIVRHAVRARTRLTRSIRSVIDG